MSDQTPPTPYPSGSRDPDPRPGPTQHEQSRDDQSDQSVPDKASAAAQASGQAAADVAQTAAGAAQDVAAETASQARRLAGKTGQQLTEQAGVHKDAVAHELTSLADQLAAMTKDVEQDGIAVEFAARARDRARDAARWLEARDPGDVLEELRTLGRQRPGAYLAGALAAGVLAGRLTRSAVAVHTEPSKGGNDTADDDSAERAHPVASVGLEERSRSADPSDAPKSGSGGRHGLAEPSAQGGLYSDTAISSRPNPGSTP